MVEISRPRLQAMRWAVSIERFEGPSIVEGLRLARSAAADTLKARRRAERAR